VSGRELVTVKTRVPRTVADELHELAKRRANSVATELRAALDKHLTDARKDGR